MTRGSNFPFCGAIAWRRLRRQRPADRKRLSSQATQGRERIGAEQLDRQIGGPEYCSEPRTAQQLRIDCDDYRARGHQHSSNCR